MAPLIWARKCRDIFARRGHHWQSLQNAGFAPSGRFYAAYLGRELANVLPIIHPGDVHEVCFLTGYEMLDTAIGKRNGRFDKSSNELSFVGRVRRDGNGDGKIKRL